MTNEEMFNNAREMLEDETALKAIKHMVLTRCHDAELVEELINRHGFKQPVEEHGLTVEVEACGGIMRISFDDAVQFVPIPDPQ